MAVKIRPIVLADAASYRACRDTVARERRYLPEYNAPPLTILRARLRKLLRNKPPFLVAVDDERVVGWAAVYRPDLPSLNHNGDFVMALLPQYRESGLDAKLMAGVLKLARGKFYSVTLTVFRKNKPARKLYEKMGFETCFEIKRGVKLAYGFDDEIVMQKILPR